MHHINSRDNESVKSNFQIDLILGWSLSNSFLIVINNADTGFHCVSVKLGDFCKYIEFWVKFVSLDSAADQAWQDKYDCLLWQKLEDLNTCHLMLGAPLALCYGPEPIGNIFRISFANFVLHDFGKFKHNL